MRGWYKMLRGWMDHPSFSREPFTDREAFLWMVENATWEPEGTTYMVPGTNKSIALKRGQLAFSLRFLAEKWGWSLGKVRRYIDRLKTGTVIDTATDTGTDTATGTGLTIITLCEYEEIQGKIFQTGTEADTGTDTDTDTATGTKIKNIRNKELKEIEIDKSISSKKSSFSKKGKSLVAELGEDLKPPRQWAEYCQQKHFKDQEWAFAEWEKFRDYHLARGTISKDWNASWRTWVGKAIEFQGRA